MNKKELYSKIRDLAVNLCKEGDVFSRVDVASELGMPDSPQVGRLVYEAYLEYKHDKRIESAFMNNSWTQSIVAEESVRALLDEDRMDDALKAIGSKLESAGRNLEDTSRSLSIVLKETGVKVAAGTLSTLTGTAGAESVKKKAADAFDKYSSLIGYYDKARDEVRNVISDFTSLRTNINAIYRKFSAELIDIFGDAVRKIDPKLFDFESIEWLDTSTMLKDANLEFGQLTQSCGLLINEISDSFGKTLNESSALYQGSQDRAVGLALAVINLAGHYIGAGQRTAELSRQYLQLEKRMVKDAASIKGDVMRLGVIYKNVNEVFIPQANAFYRFGDKVMTEETEALIDSIYQSSEELRQLKSQRDALIDEMRRLENDICDIETNISFYDRDIANDKELIRAEADQYHSAMDQKPKKPGFPVSVFKKGDYAREYSEWHILYGDFVKAYEAMKLDILMEEKEKKVLVQTLKMTQSNYSKLRKNMDDISVKMRALIKDDAEAKRAVAKNLDKVVRLLHVAKDILENKLDDSLLKSASIPDPEKTNLPAEVASRLNGFITEEFAPIETEDADEVDAAADVVVQETGELLKALVNLQAMKVSNLIAARDYQRKLAQLKEGYKAQIEAVNRRSDALRDALKRINLATDRDELIEGLSALTDGRVRLTESDLDLILSGQKKIEI